MLTANPTTDWPARQLPRLHNSYILALLAAYPGVPWANAPTVAEDAQGWPEKYRCPACKWRGWYEVDACPDCGGIVDAGTRCERRIRMTAYRNQRGYRISPKLMDCGNWQCPKCGTRRASAKLERLIAVLYLEPGAYVTLLDTDVFKKVNGTRATTLSRLVKKDEASAYVYIVRGSSTYVVSTFAYTCDSKWLDRDEVVHLAASTILALPGPRRVEFSSNHWDEPTADDYDDILDAMGFGRLDELVTFGEFHGWEVDPYDLLERQIKVEMLVGLREKQRFKDKNDAVQRARVARSKLRRKAIDAGSNPAEVEAIPFDPNGTVDEPRSKGLALGSFRGDNLEAATATLRGLIGKANLQLRIEGLSPVELLIEPGRGQMAWSLETSKPLTWEDQDLVLDLALELLRDLIRSGAED